jgi:hypothetical protein
MSAIFDILTVNAGIHRLINLQIIYKSIDLYLSCIRRYASADSLVFCLFGFLLGYHRSVKHDISYPLEVKGGLLRVLAVLAASKKLLLSEIYHFYYMTDILMPFSCYQFSKISP